MAEKALPGGDVADVGATPHCYLCGADAELTYCSFCKKYFCAGCERDYPSRVIAATVEGMTALKNFLASVLPAEPAAAPTVSPPRDKLCCGQRRRKD